MTIQELLQHAGRYPWALLGVFVSVPVVTWVVGRLHRRERGGATPWKYIYATLVYISCVPGLFAAVVTGYMLFFTSANLLEVNALVYLLPAASMVVTLILLGKNVDFDAVPGFHRLSGLMTLIGVSFAIALAISKTRLWIFFGGSIVLPSSTNSAAGWRRARSGFSRSPWERVGVRAEPRVQAVERDRAVRFGPANCEPR